MPQDLSFDLSDSIRWEVMFTESNKPSQSSTETPKKDKNDTVSDPSDPPEPWGPCMEPVCP